MKQEDLRLEKKEVTGILQINDNHRNLTQTSIAKDCHWPFGLLINNPLYGIVGLTL